MKEKFLFYMAFLLLLCGCAGIMPEIRDRWKVDNPLLALKDRGAMVMTAASGSETAK